MHPHPNQVYPREGLIPQRAWSLLDVTPLLAAARDGAEMARLATRTLRALTLSLLSLDPDPMALLLALSPNPNQAKLEEKSDLYPQLVLKQLSQLPSGQQARYLVITPCSHSWRSYSRASRRR